MPRKNWSYSAPGLKLQGAATPGKGESNTGEGGVTVFTVFTPPLNEGVKTYPDTKDKGGSSQIIVPLPRCFKPKKEMGTRFLMSTGPHPGKPTLK